MSSGIVLFIIDIEASGFGPQGYPIEVGVALQPGKRFSSLVKPLPQWNDWDTDAANVHGITQQTLLAHGRPVDWVAVKLNDLLRNCTVYTDAWVVDKPWLAMLFYAAGVAMEFDISPIERLLSDEQLANWDATKQQVLLDLPAQRHRASHDAWIIQETICRCIT